MIRSRKLLGVTGGAITLLCFVNSYNAAAADPVAVAAAPAVPAAAPASTLWRFMGIPQGIRAVRDVTVNRRGNFPGLERKPPMKRIADPANLLSDNPAIKAAAEIKQAEDMKAQKIKAIKFLATIGCGCYDKDGKITEALLAATDDCTPDVRLASIEAIEEAASGCACKSCGSTSCCNEKVNKRLSEIAYERDDSGCYLESSAEIRAAAKRTLCKCCPGGPPTGPIEEEIIEEEPTEAAIPTPPEEPEPVTGESVTDDDEVTGESTSDSELDGESNDDGLLEEDFMEEESPSDQNELESPELNSPEAEDLVQSPSLLAPVDVQLGDEKLIGGLVVQPVTLTIPSEQNVAPEPVSVKVASARRPSESSGLKYEQPRHLPMPINASQINSAVSVSMQPTVAPRRTVMATVVGVNQKTGQLVLKGRGFDRGKIGAGAVVYHEFLTGERMVGHLVIQNVGNQRASARVTDKSMLKQIHVGDRAVCQ